MLSLFGIILGLALLIFLAFRGKSLLWAAPICALVVALTGGLDLFTAYTQDYMQGFVDFVLEWFPAFMLGAIFGQIMQDSGGARFPDEGGCEAGRPGQSHLRLRAVRRPAGPTAASPAS